MIIRVLKENYLFTSFQVRNSNKIQRDTFAKLEPLVLLEQRKWWLIKSRSKKHILSLEITREKCYYSKIFKASTLSDVAKAIIRSNSCPKYRNEPDLFLSLWRKPRGTRRASLSLHYPKKKAHGGAARVQAGFLPGPCRKPRLVFTGYSKGGMGLWFCSSAAKSLLTFQVRDRQSHSWRVFLPISGFIGTGL